MLGIRTEFRHRLLSKSVILKTQPAHFQCTVRAICAGLDRYAT